MRVLEKFSDRRCIDLLLKYIKLENFKCYNDVKLTFSQGPFTVIVGENAVGKTAMLEGIAVGIGAFLNGFDDIPKKHISSDEIRLKKFLKGSTATVEPQFPVIVECEGRIDFESQELIWSRSLNRRSGKTTQKGSKAIINYSQYLQEQVMIGEDVNLPIIAYYGTQRLWNTGLREKRNSLKELKSRTHAYLDCLKPEIDMKLLIQWFMDKKYISLEDGVEPGELKAVQKAIQVCLKDFEGIEELNLGRDFNLEYSVRSKDLQFTDGKTTLPFRLLSDGYRNVIGLVADIAFRMASLNPHLEENAVLETSGIILIDEIDLHLHPKWQRRIIDDLKRTFPKVQFIVSTHSPFVIQSLNQGELRILNKEGQIISGEIVTDDQEIVPIEYQDESVEDILEYIMGVKLPQWGKRKKDMYNTAREYFKLLSKYENENLDTSEIKKIKDELDTLIKPFSDNVAYYAFLEQKRLVAEIKRGDQDNEAGQ